MPVISDEKVTDETLEAWKNEAMISLKTTSRDYHDYSHHEAIYALVTELQERRKAETEPVAWTDEEELRDLRKVGFCEMFSVEPISKDADMLRVIPLYRHVQPAPVVPEEITDESTEQRLMGRRWAHSFCAGWNACRAAMLKGDAK